jgi:hypothetical protein
LERPRARARALASVRPGQTRPRQGSPRLTPIAAPPPPPSPSTLISRRWSKASMRKSTPSRPISRPCAPPASRSPRSSMSWSPYPASGQKTAAALIALMPELGSLPRRQAAALAGLAPHPNQSGQTDAYRRTRGGRPEVKRILFMAAISAAKQTRPPAPSTNASSAQAKSPSSPSPQSCENASSSPTPN